MRVSAYCSFTIQVDGLMGLGGEPEREEGGTALRTLGPLRWCGEFFGLIALLLFACKNLK